MCHKSILALTIASCLAMPTFAQSRVTLSGKINAAYEWSKATGATFADGDIKMRDRMIESGSEIRIIATENLGNGNEVFVNIQTAVDIFGGNNVATSNAGRIGSRRAAIGLKGRWGTLMLGKWDIYENTSSWAGTEANALNQTFNARGILAMIGGNSYAKTGCRCDNTIRYVTPSLNGFELAIAYTRNGKGENGGELAWQEYNANKVDRTISAQFKYKHGGFKLGGGFWYRQNAQGGIGVQSAHHERWEREYANLPGYGVNAQATLRNETSFRAGMAYTFDMGITLGFNYDFSKTEHKFASTQTNNLNGNKITLERSAWNIPIYYKTGPHSFNFAYGYADDLKGWEDTGAQYWTVSYGYNLSKRTTLYGGFARYNNDKYASYDFWSSSAIGLASQNVGADPTTFMVGIIHSF